jgi:hypothetical protein
MCGARQEAYVCRYKDDRYGNKGQEQIAAYKPPHLSGDLKECLVYTVIVCLRLASFALERFALLCVLQAGLFGLLALLNVFRVLRERLEHISYNAVAKTAEFGRMIASVPARKLWMYDGPSEFAWRWLLKPIVRDCAAGGDEPELGLGAIILGRGEAFLVAAL